MVTDAWLGALLGGVLAAGVLLIASATRRSGRVAERRASSRQRAGERLRLRLLRAGIPGLSPAGFVVLSVLAAVIAAALAEALLSVPGFALAAGCAGAALPWALVNWRLAARRSATRGAWPDVVDHLVAAVRSGVALPEAVAALATLGPEATREQFSRFGRDFRATGAFARCADALKEELADPVADRIIETLKMAREVGGTELVSVLRALAASLREDAATRNELHARQTWVVNAARLGVAAPWLVLALLATRPEGREAYGTAAGTTVIVVAAVVSVVAYRVMIAIGRLPEERRWFR
ncbi:type II secretion system F family protein [Gryllotalpicola kribbensis]|uniref:Type II secretion system F family protein n=1 Tax=Gryllotalpicola kribbensis TaxID=993084 RepID=A0ABP8ALN7_9MICO